MTRSEFNNLVKKISRKLYAQAYRILKDREGSEDAVQEVFIKLWKMNTRLYEYSSPEALATTMIRNYCIDQIRKQKLIMPGDNLNHGLLDETELTPFERLVSIETYSHMQRIIDGLPELYRSIIQMRDIDDISYEEIALLTGQNINTLRVNLSRARKTVRDEFKKFENEA